MKSIILLFAVSLLAISYVQQVRCVLSDPSLLNHMFGMGNEYRASEEIGRGDSGVIYKGIHEYLGSRCAIKTQLATPGNNSIEHEYSIYMILNTEENDLIQSLGLPVVFEKMRKRVGNQYFDYFRMKKYDGNAMEFHFTEMGRSNTPFVRVRTAIKIMFRLLKTLRYIHSKRIVYNNMSWSNVLLDTDHGYVILIDFSKALNLNRPNEVPHERMRSGSQLFWSFNKHECGNIIFHDDLESLVWSTWHIIGAEEKTPFNVRPDNWKQMLAGKEYAIENIRRYFNFNDPFEKAFILFSETVVANDIVNEDLYNILELILLTPFPEEEKPEMLLTAEDLPFTMGLSVQLTFETD